VKYFDISVETEQLYDVQGGMDVRTRYLGTQFYQGEPIQLWSDYRGQRIDLYRWDGSRETLLDHPPQELIYSDSGYLDQEGNFYCWQRNKTLIKTALSGERVYSRALSDSGAQAIRDFCQMPDGRVFLIYEEEKEGEGIFPSIEFGWLEPATGLISKISEDEVIDHYLGVGADGLYCLDNYGLWKIAEGDGSREEVITFSGTSYILKKEGSTEAAVGDFQVLEDGGIELLRVDSKGGSWSREKLAQVEISEGKKPVVVRGWYYNSWFKSQVALFNQSNDEYYVVLEDCSRYAGMKECARICSVEVASGKGPDVFYGDVLGDYAYGIMQKGGLENLAPYMKKSGIKEEDYYPAAFGWRRDGKKIYGVQTQQRCVLYTMDPEFLGVDSAPDLDTLADILLSWEGEDIFMLFKDSSEVLRMLLEGSEDLWGALDWKRGTCDFGGELFAKLLQVAKRYGDDENNSYWGLVYEDNSLILTDDKSTSFIPDRNAILEKEGRVAVGPLFDDGCHAVAEIEYSNLAINAASSNKQGAWELICYLLGDEAQATIGLDQFHYPVSRQVFEAAAEEMLAKVRDGKISNQAIEVVERKLEKSKSLLENIRFIPTRTEPILDIVCEEAEDYFSGIKGMEEVISVMENRVEIYLKESQ